MANLTTVTRPYARAVLSLARENCDYAKWSEMLEFLAAIAQDPLGYKFLNNLAVSYLDKANFICALAPDVLTQQGKNLVKILARSKRLAIFPELLMLYEKMRKQEQGQVTLHLTIAQDTSKNELKNFELTYANKIKQMITMTEQVEPALLAGGIAQIDNQVIDASISGRLRAMRDLLRD